MLELYQAYADCADFMGLVNLITGRVVRAAAESRVTRADPVIQPAEGRCNGRGGGRRGESRSGPRDFMMRRTSSRPARGSASAGQGRWRRGALARDLREACERGLLQPSFIHSYPTEVAARATARLGPFVTDRTSSSSTGAKLANRFSGRSDRTGATLPRAGPAPLGRRPRACFDGDYIRALEYGMPPAAARRRNRPARHAADGFGQHPSCCSRNCEIKRWKNKASPGQRGRLPFPEGPKER